MKQRLFFLCLFPLFAYAQICSGNLGDNIFTEGDFGNGTANILLPDPNIAPSYGYSTAPPPFDGQYVITNNTGAWPGLFGSWLDIGDNSDDPNGYMMVVNADFEPALFYNQTVTDLCENTLYEFSADIINLIRSGVGGHIEPNVSFLIDGVVQFDTGNIPSTNFWQTFGFVFTTGPGVTEVELSLRNNAPGGIGNDLALDNISFRTCGDSASILPDEPANICANGDPLPLTATITGTLYDDPNVQWQISPNGINSWTDIPGATDEVYFHTLLASGQYFYRFQLANGPVNILNEKCRINSNVKTVIVLPTEFGIQDTICAGLSLQVGNSVYTETGVYVDSLLNSIGCDSVVSTALTVVPQPDMIADLAVGSSNCFNEEDGQIEILSVSGGNLPYNFTFAGQEVGMTTVFPDLMGGQDYELMITDRFGCSSMQTAFVPSPMELTLDLGGDLNLRLGELATVQADPNFTVENYTWSTTSTDELPCASSPDCDGFQWLPTSSQTIFLSAEDANNCIVTDSIELSLRSVYSIFAPNIFSPNQDGLNDAFTLFGPQPRITRINSLQVFDRWGALVFSGTDLLPGQESQGWDGTIQGDRASTGVYIYQAEVLFLDGTTRLLEGDVMLVR